ncbi:MAG: hypothetical protein U5K30_01875 [Acidimicrobiales bacterium]|nr:hypothetical protein [Acidimicrobiales bacterium]
MTGRAGLDLLHADDIESLWGMPVAGDIAVCGFGFGGPTVFLAAYLHTYDDGMPRDRRALWVMDRFRASEGFADLNQARETLHRSTCSTTGVRFLQGDVAAHRRRRLGAPRRSSAWARPGRPASGTRSERLVPPPRPRGASSLIERGERPRGARRPSLRVPRGARA